jgi:SAM-dependent methyltransferase
VSELLRYDVPGTMRPIADYLGDPWCWSPYVHLARSVQSGEPPFEKTFGEGIFDYLGKRPDEAHTFNEGMTGFSESIAAEVVKAYDFSPFHTVVDVGGGHGSLLMAILKANPKLRGVVFDADSVAVGAERAIENAGLDQRCRAEGGDFFVSVPEAGDLYVMKHIIHDWNDAKALKILKACRAAIQPGGRVLLVELVVPDEPGPSMAHWLDLEMLVVCDGKERTAKEYADLFAAAGFRQTKVLPLPGGPHCLVEAVPV